MAEVPAPRKRAILELINLIRFAEVPYYSVDGNHTSLKSSNDIHLYKILGDECDNFRGFRGPTYDPYTKVSFVPHAYDNDQIREWIEESLHRDTDIMVGHWAADDIPYVGQVSRRNLPEGVRVFLGHYHNYRPSAEHDPTYIGATEKTAWDQWDYPAGCAIYDSDTGDYQRIEIPTRAWVNLESGVSADLVEILHRGGLGDTVARLTVYSSPEEYNLIDKVAIRNAVREANPVAFTMRRKNPLTSEAVELQPAEKSNDMVTEWRTFMQDADVPKSTSRKRITQLGIDYLSG